MKTRPAILIALILPLSFGSANAEEPIPNDLIDSAEFQRVVGESLQLREQRRLTEEAFLAALREKNIVVLDARSAANYARRHITGAVNLPFTEFTAETLAEVIPSPGTKVLIYCNNNFNGAPVSFAAKAAPASLNLSTYTNLAIYGYTNIWELGPLLDVDRTELPFSGSEVD